MVNQYHLNKNRVSTLRHKPFTQRKESTDSQIEISGKSMQKGSKIVQCSCPLGIVFETVAKVESNRVHH